MVVEPRDDAYGQLLVAALEGEDVVEIVERQDGFISASAMGPRLSSVFVNTLLGPDPN